MSDAQGSDDATEGVTDASADEGVEANVETALREFLDALGESETYQRFVEADSVTGTTPARWRYSAQYQRKQQQMQRGGFDESVMAELKRLQTELSNNETIQRQQAAQADLIELLRRTDERRHQRHDRRGVCAIHRRWVLLSASDQDAAGDSPIDDEVVAAAGRSARNSRQRKSRPRSSRSRRW